MTNDARERAWRYIASHKQLLRMFAHPVDADSLSDDDTDAEYDDIDEEALKAEVAELEAEIQDGLH